MYNTKHGLTLHGQAYNFGTYYEPFLKKTVPLAGKVLELGCGTGFYTRWLLDRGLEVAGIDISLEMLKRAKALCPEASFYQGDCEDPASYLQSSIPEQGFEAIIGVNTFSYYPNKEKALAHYHKLLHPGGRFVVIDMNGRSPYYQLMAWMNINEMREWIIQIRDSNQSYLSRILEQNGFTVDAIDFFAFLPNGVGFRTVCGLQRLDALLHAVSPINRFAMRIAIAATKR